MAIKIGGAGFSDIVIGAASGGKDNVSKVVIGNAGGSGTILWQKSTPPPVGSGRFIAVSNSGNTYALADGSTTWTNVSSQGYYLTSIAYGNGRYVGFELFTSYQLVDGGSLWEEISGSPDMITAVAYGNGRFLLITGIGACYELVDGSSSWSSLGITFPGVSISCLAYGNGRFVVLDSTGSYELVDGGTTWNSISGAPLFETPCGLDYGIGRFALMYDGWTSGGSASTYLLSDGSTTWTSIPSISEIATSMKYGGGRFVAITASGHCEMTDGSNSWTMYSTGDNLSNLAYGNGRFVGTNGTSTSVLADGSSAWTAIGTLADTVRCIAHGN